MADPEFDRAFGALANGHRRQLLLALLEKNPQREVSIPVETDLDAEEREAIRLEVYHFHFPHLESEGFIEWDQEADSVSKGPNFEEIRPLPELLNRHRDDLPDDWF